MKIFTTTILFAIASSSCESNMSNEIHNKYDSISTTMNTTRDDTLLVKSTVTNFLKWYKNNYPKLSFYQLVPNSMDSIEDNIYNIDSANVEQYLLLLKSSNYVTNHYISIIRNYIYKCNDEMLAMKQMEGIPEGLDFDLVLKTHDCEESLTKIDNALPYNIIINNSKATAKVKLAYELEFHLLLVDNEWKIDE